LRPSGSSFAGRCVIAREGAQRRYSALPPIAAIRFLRGAPSYGAALLRHGFRWGGEIMVPARITLSASEREKIGVLINNIGVYASQLMHQDLPGVATRAL